MRVFFGGQIKKECRGDLAVVVERDKTFRNQERYKTFLYPTDSEEFVHLTGARAACCLNERVYIGVSHDAGEDVIRCIDDRTPDRLDLKNIDGLVVIPYFLNANQEKPKRVVLESTADGYRVVEAK